VGRSSWRRGPAESTRNEFRLLPRSFACRSRRDDTWTRSERGAAGRRVRSELPSGPARHRDRGRARGARPGDALIREAEYHRGAAEAKPLGGGPCSRPSQLGCPLDVQRVEGRSLPGSRPDLPGMPYAARTGQNRTGGPAVDSAPGQLAPDGRREHLQQDRERCHPPYRLVGPRQRDGRRAGRGDECRRGPRRTRRSRERASSSPSGSKPPPGS
jgi:hypothetical protein